MVDQESRFGDHVVRDRVIVPERPGLFQVSINDVGNLSVSRNESLLGSLEQESLVTAYHDVLSEGPVWKRLKHNLRKTLSNNPAVSPSRFGFEQMAEVEDELLVRRQNAVCRLVLNIQRYGHGGGLLIVPSCPAESVNVKYELYYDRLPKALVGLAEHQLLKRQALDNIARFCETPSRVLPCEIHKRALEYERRFYEHTNEALGCGRFIASLSRVDGFVLLDQCLVVHGFGVEARADCELDEVYLAADSKATPRLLKPVPLCQFGTRHRAMIRYCHQNAGALGFVISQDGDIRATMNV